MDSISQTEKDARVEALLEENQKAAYLLVRRDMELTKANEKLQELDAVKSQFVDLIAHQLRTPLTGTRWAIDMLLNDELGGALTDTQKDILIKGQKSNTRMITLVNSMLQVDNIESGKSKYVFAPLKIKLLLDTALVKVTPIIDAKNLTTINLADNTITVLGDPEKIQIVLNVVLENAVKYTMDNGTIEIQVTQKEAFTEVSVKDNGIGIPKESQKYIFRSFFRAKNAVRMETDGSGLGLFLSKKIIEKHGGKMWFESEENKGTTFYFTLPTEDMKT